MNRKFRVFYHSSTNTGHAERTNRIMAQRPTLNLAALFDEYLPSMPAVPATPPPWAYPAVPLGIWNIVTTRIGEPATTAGNGRTLSETTTATAMVEVRVGTMFIASTEPAFEDGQGGPWNWDAWNRLDRTHAFVIVERPTIGRSTYIVEYAASIGPGTDPNSPEIALVTADGVSILFELPIPLFFLVIPMQDSRNPLATVVRRHITDWQNAHPPAQTAMERILDSVRDADNSGSHHGRNRPAFHDRGRERSRSRSRGKSERRDRTRRTLVDWVITNTDGRAMAFANKDAYRHLYVHG